MPPAPGRPACARPTRSTRRTSTSGSPVVSGVEGFVEPRTAVSEVTLLLVANDGEWTRRRVPGVKWAHDFCNKHQVPSYDAAVVGIPQRMRDYNSRIRKAQKAADYQQYKPRES